MNASILISTLAAVTCLATSASAEAPSAATPVCPARYEAMDGLCFDKSSGDVVMAEATAAAPTPAVHCSAGYTILFETLCYSSSTGDIERASTVVILATGKTN